MLFLSILATLASIVVSVFVVFANGTSDAPSEGFPGGRIIPALNLAANWLRFPRAMPAPRMAAARRGHVFVLEHHISGKVWMVFDANSGRGRTRLHPRSIAGFTIVNPHGSG